MFKAAVLFIASFLLAVAPLSDGRTEERSDSKNILILNSYDWGTSWTDEQVMGFREVVLGSDIHARIFIEQLDVLAHRGSFDDEGFSRHLDWRFGDRKFDLLFVTDNAALKYAARNYQERFRGMPVVFSDVNGLDRIEFPTDMPVTGVSEHRDFRSTLELAASLRPNAKEIVVFGLSADNGSGRRKIQRYLSELNYRIPIRLHLDKSLEEIIDIASRIDPANIVFSMARAVDANGVVQGYEQVLRFISEASPAPLFSFWGGAGNFKYTVGGKVSQPVTQGQTAGGLAVRILNGESADDMPIQVAPTSYVFNYPMMVRHRIKESDLPEGSEVRDRPFSVYEEYTLTIWSTVLLIASLSGAVFLLLTNIRRRRSAEIALAASYDRLEDKVQQRTKELVAVNANLNDTLDTLTRTQEQLVESEKMAALGGLVSGVAHEINTPIGVSLTAASHFDARTGDLSSDYRKGELDRQDFENFLNEAKQTAGILLTNLGRAADLIRSFKQVAVDQSAETTRPIDLKTYLETTIESLLPELKAGRHVVEIECDEGLLVETYPGIIAQVLTNLVVNSARHGFGPERTGGRIRIRANDEDGMITLFYGDDGKGMAKDVLKSAFEPFFTTARGQGGSGLGLSIVYNLVTHKLKGRMTCESKPGEGTTFVLTFPPSMTSGEISNSVDVS